jgi:hypothetical protein
VTERRYPRDVFMALESRAKVGWAKYYDTQRENEQLQQMIDVLKERLETLIPYTLRLTESVLTKRNIDAFADAYKLHNLINEFRTGSRHG